MGITGWKSLLLAVPLLLTGTLAQAESVVDVTVPFAFTVQDHLMPAGSYRVEHDPIHPGTLVIREQNGAHATMVVATMTASGKDPIGERSTLVFSHHDNAYQLKDVWQSGTEGEEIVPALPSRHEVR